MKKPFVPAPQLPLPFPKPRAPMLSPTRKAGEEKIPHATRKTTHPDGSNG